MKVVLAYPNRLVADGLKCLISSQEGVEVVATCTDPASVAEAVGRYRPDSLVVHVSFIDTDRPGYIKAINAMWAPTTVVAISPWPSREEFLWVIEAGVGGYVGIDISSSQFLDAIRKVSAGEVVISGIEQKSPESSPSDGAQVAKLMNLTPREKEILGLLSHGFSNKQIAEDLYLSEHTVRTHVQNLRSKLNVRSKFQAAMLLMQSGNRATNGIKF